jgi:hypothetical protein
LPVSPSHVAVTAGLVLTQLAPGLKPEPKGIVTSALIGVYVLGESIYASIRAKRPELPQEILSLQAKVRALEEGK